MRRRRLWVLLAATLAVLVAGALVALPSVIRWAAVSGIRSATGRDVEIGHVALNVFTGRLAVIGFRLADRHAGPPFAEIDRVEARFRLLPLLRRRLQLDSVTLVRPRLRLARAPSGELSTADLIERFGKGDASQEPADVVLGRFTLEDGVVTFVDQAVMPSRTWEAAGVALELRDIVTRSDTARGTVSARFTLAGAPVTLEADGIRVRPARARATVTVTELDLAGLWAYLPPDAPLRAQGGRFTTRLEVEYSAEAGVRAGGDVTLAALALLRPGQSEPLVSTPLLRMTSRDVVYRDGVVTAAHLALSGDPSILDASVSPPQRYDLTDVRVTLDGASYPTRAPAQLSVTAGLPAGGALDVRGSAELQPLAASLDVALNNVDLGLARPYVPAGTPVTIGDGRLGARVKVVYGVDASVRADGHVTATRLALLRPGEAEPFLTTPALTATVADARLRDGAFTLQRLVVSGAPTLADASVTPPRRLALRTLRLEAAGLSWPAAGPARVRVAGDLPESGTIAARGTVTLARRRADLTVDLNDVALAPYQPWLPTDAAVAGRLDTALKITATLEEPLEIVARGAVTVRSLALGAGADAPLTLERAAATGIDVRWPSRVSIARVTLTRPHLLLERDQDGAFPLRAMLVPRASAEPSAAGEPPPAAAPAATSAPMAVDIAEMVIEDGDGRFLDRTTTPFYSEDISRLAVTVRDLRNAPESRADVTVQGVIGAGGALDLKGQVAPFGDPFFLDLAGEVRNISITKTNPYVRYYSGWIARRGSVSTRLHYRIVGDQLDASNDILVQSVAVERAPAEDSAVSRRVGLPLGMIVAIITDSRGNIEFSVPVAGKLSAPEFSFGAAVWAAIKNVLVNVVAAPFRAIGKVFKGGEGVDAETQLQVDPVAFEAGSAAMSADAQRQLQRVAEFLRASPYVKLVIEPVVSAEDIASLRTQEAVARIQQLQRERQLAEFGEAAVEVFRQAHPDEAVPKTADEIVAALRESEPPPDEASQRLASHRFDVTRKALVEVAGVEGDRVESTHTPRAPGAVGGGRVEFHLKP
jgi:hypothetical protein